MLQAPEDLLTDPQVSIAAGTAKKGTERKAVNMHTAFMVKSRSPSGKPCPTSIGNRECMYIYM